MNCKPGQMAMVVRGEPKENLGRVVRVLERVGNPSELIHGCVLWFYEGDLSMGDGTRAEAVADDCLRPLKDPGDDARDETLSWLDVPSKQGEPA